MCCVAVQVQHQASPSVSAPTGCHSSSPAQPLYYLVTEKNPLSRNEQADHLIADCTLSHPVFPMCYQFQLLKERCCITSCAFRWQHNPSFKKIATLASLNTVRKTVPCICQSIKMGWKQQQQKHSTNFKYLKHQLSGRLVDIKTLCTILITLK